MKNYQITIGYKAIICIPVKAESEEKAKEALKELDIYPEDGQVLLSRKIIDGRSINKINGETSTVGQMKAAAACLLDIHGQHDNQTLLHRKNHLTLLDLYGKEQTDPLKEKMASGHKSRISQIQGTFIFFAICIPATIVRG